MNKLVRKYLFLITSITSIFLSACNLGDGIMERNEEPLASAYANFQELNENYRSTHFEVKLICEAQGYPHPIRVFPSINKQWIIEADAEKSDETQGDYIFYKLNGAGNITDTLYLTYKGYWAELIDVFMVFTNYEEAYYTTWPLDGDTTKRYFKVLNADLNWSADKVNQHIENAKANSKYWFCKYITNNENSYLKFYYYQNKQWQILWQKVEGFQTVRDEESAGRYSVEVIRTGETDTHLAENITYLHHHRLEKLSYSHNIGGGNPGFDVTNWRGKAFFKTSVNDRDFHFFEPNIAVENEQSDGNKNRFYIVSEPNASAIIFTPLIYKVPNSFAFYTSDRNKLYLIKEKIRSK